MPKPPMLEILDWKSIYESGTDFGTWLEQGESEKNRQTMNRVREELALPDGVADTLRSFTRPIHVIAIAEDWCGDVVRHAPVLQKMADENEAIQVRYIARAGNETVFVRFLTNGGEALPKFVFLNDAFVECGNWGPMPQAFREFISRGKACGDVAAARKIIADAYRTDADRDHVMAELLYLFGTAGATAVE